MFLKLMCISVFCITERVNIKKIATRSYITPFADSKKNQRPDIVRLFPSFSATTDEKPVKNEIRNFWSRCHYIMTMVPLISISKKDRNKLYWYWQLYIVKLLQQWLACHCKIYKCFSFAVNRWTMKNRCKLIKGNGVII